MALSLGVRASSLALCNGLGCYGGLAWAIVLAVGSLLTTDAPVLFMTEEVLQESGTSSWIRDLSCSVSEIEDTGTSVNQPAQGTVPPGEAAEPSNPLAPHSYKPDEGSTGKL